MSQMCKKNTVSCKDNGGGLLYDKRKDDKILGGTKT